MWGRVKPLSGRELEQAGKTLSEASHEVTIRYREDVTADKRFRLLNGRILQIVSPGVDRTERNRELAFIVKERP